MSFAHAPRFDDTGLVSPTNFFMKKTVQSLRLSATAATAASMMRASSAMAQFAGPTPDVGGLPDAADPNSFRGIIESILVTVLNFLALVAVVVIVIAGIRMIISQGNEDEMDKAKKTIFYALIGLVVVLFARVIVSLVTVYLYQTV